MAGGDPRFGTTATYMCSLNHCKPRLSSQFYHLYDYKNAGLFNHTNPLARKAGKVRSRHSFIAADTLAALRKIHHGDTESTEKIPRFLGLARNLNLRVLRAS